MDQYRFAYEYSIYVSNYINYMNEGIELNNQLMLSNSGGNQSHGSTASSKGPVKVFPCKYCPKKFIDPRALGGHQNAHKKERTKLSSSSSSVLVHVEANSIGKLPKASFKKRSATTTTSSRSSQAASQKQERSFYMDPSSLHNSNDGADESSSAIPCLDLEFTPTSSHHQLHLDHDQDQASVGHTLDLNLHL